MSRLLVTLVLCAAVGSAVTNAQDPHHHHPGGHHGPQHRGQIRRSVHTVQHKAAHIAQTLRGLRAPAYVQDAADNVVAKANHMDQTLHTWAPGRREHLQHDFEDVERAVRRLDREFRRSHEVHHNAHVQADLRELHQAVTTLRAALGGTVAPPRTATQNIRLGSSRYRYNSVNLPGTITALAIVGRPHSNAACQLGYSYGHTGNTLWVHRGCEATFQVTYLAP